MFRFISEPLCAASILGGEIRFTPIAALNDPAELLPRFDRNRVLESLARMRQSGHTDADIERLRRQESLLRKLAPEHQIVNAPRTPAEADRVVRSSAYDDMIFMEKMLGSAAATISSRVAVACFSERANSLPMWAHYASNAKGFCVEYQNLECVFKGDETDLLGRILKVDYDDGPIGITFDTESYVKLFTSKFYDWSYELERRVVLALRDLRGEGSCRFFDLPRSHIRVLILGWNMPVETERQLRRQVEAMAPHVEVKRASLDRGRVLY